jgi:octanoyl-[GcvH]:protein N-octanoyltransferase
MSTNRSSRRSLGELPGEYCPGRVSLHLRSGPKVAGVAQRVLARASLTTAVVVVAGGDALRATLTDVYAALDLPVDADAAGAVSDTHPNITSERVLHMILGTWPTGIGPLALDDGG